MGDVIAIVGLIVFVCCIVVGVIYGVSSNGQRRSMASRPVSTLGLHDEEAIVARAGDYFRLSQRAVRVLDTLERDPAVWMTAETRTEIKSIVNDFYQ